LGTYKRAEERERARRANARSIYAVVLTWTSDGPNLLLNFLDPKTRLPLTRQRVVQDPKAVVGLVQRSLTDIGHGPKEFLFRKALEAGRGELEIEISGAQFARL
jgi:hypothetical protein